MSSLLERLKERKLFQWALAYLAGAWLVLQLVEVLGQIFQWSLALQQGITIFLAFGFFLTLVLAWYHGEKGRQRASGPELLMIAALLAIAAILLTVVRPEEETAPTSEPMLAGEAEKPAIAVLPFDNISPDPSDAYFADGMHEEITSQLSQVSAIKVISRTSVMQYREEKRPVRDIAAELGVDYVLEGSARKAEDRVRLTVQLIDADRDEHVWADEYDRDLTAAHLFEIQSEVAERVASALEVELTASERERIERHATENLAAYDHYLRGRFFSQEHTPAGWRRGVQSFERAIDLDSTFARAYVGLAYCHRELARVFSTTAGEGYEKATEALTKAIEIDENLGEAYAALGSIGFIADWDMSGPESYFQRAMQLSPGSADVYLLYAQYLLWLGRSDESIEMAARAVELDPFAPLVNVWLGVAYFYANRYDDSINQHKRVLELDPSNVWGHTYLAHNYVMKGMNAAAVAHADTVQAISRTTGNPGLVAFVGGDYARAGERDEAERILEIVLDLHAQGTVGAMAVALIYAGLGERDSTFVWLRRGVQERGGTVVWLNAYGRTHLRDLRPDPRYDELLRLVGFED